MKKHLVLGGTGTLGQAIIKKLRLDPENEIVCLSRDEFKQHQMKKIWPEDQRMHYVLGDIRDLHSIERYFAGVHTVFHVAALKQIDTLEANPYECIKTNLLGTINVAKAATDYNVPFVVFSSTDKAVMPINLYGMCKAASELVLKFENKFQKRTQFIIYRWGNVLSSRGSVIPIFQGTLREGKAHITDKHMTRFWIKIEQAVEFILSTYQKNLDEVMIPPMKGASVVKVVEAIADSMGVKKYELIETGLRPGEKINETIFVDDRGSAVSSNTVAQFTKAELKEFLSQELA